MYRMVLLHEFIAGMSFIKTSTSVLGSEVPSGLQVPWLYASSGSLKEHNISETVSASLFMWKVG
jgi:hypothetical protein